MVDPVFSNILFFLSLLLPGALCLVSAPGALDTAISIIRMICAHLEPITIKPGRRVILLLESASIRR